MKRRLVGIAVLSLVILVVAWWLPDRDDGQKRLNPERLPTETRVYDIHALNAEPAVTQEDENPEAEAESPPNISPEFGQLSAATADDMAAEESGDANAENSVAPAPVETTASRQAIPKPSTQPTIKPAASTEPTKAAATPEAKPAKETKPAENPVKVQPAAVAKPTPKPVAKEVNQEAAKPAQSLPSGGWIIQVGSYGQQSNADSMRKKLEAKGYRVMVTSGQVNGKTFHRVRVGPYPKKADAQSSAQNLEKLLGQKVAVLTNH